MVYCDTSFLAALYVPDALTSHAQKLASKFNDGILFTLLVELELSNRFHRAIGEKRITEAQYALAGIAASSVSDIQLATFRHKTNN